MADKTSLKELKGTTDELLNRLHAAGITSVEELIAYYAATKDDPLILTGALNINHNELAKLIKQAQKALPKEILEELTRPLPAGEMPFGALDPDLLNNKQ